MDSQLKARIIKAIIRGFQRNGERTFDISQSTASCYCPVDSGFLKRSGAIELLPNGIKIIYRAPYSADVEFGRTGQPITGDQIVHVKAHRRKAKGGKRKTINVKAHTVVYKNKRVIKIRPRLGKFEFGPPSFRVISNTGTTKAQLFLTRAVREGIKFLAQDLKTELASLGGVK